MQHIPAMLWQLLEHLLIGTVEQVYLTRQLLQLLQMVVSAIKFFVQAHRNGKNLAAETMVKIC